MKKTYLLPSPAQIFFLGSFLLLSLAYGGRLLDDGDSGYHIRTGEIILKTFSLPPQDVFSFVSPPALWMIHEWLSDVIMAAIHRVAGLTGVVLVFSFLISLFAAFLFKIVKTECNIVLAILLTLLALSSSMPHWLARPHIFSYLLLLAWTYVLDRYQYQDKNQLYLLPLLQIAWVNLHGSFVLGWILLGIYLVGNFFSGKSQQVRSLLATAFACLLVSMLNPHGVKLLTFPFQVVSSPWLTDQIREFLSPDFHKIMPFRYLIFLTLTLFAFSPRRVNGMEWMLVLFFLHMSLYSVRYVPLFAIISTPILARLAQAWLEKSRGPLADFLNRREKAFQEIQKQITGVLWPVIGLVGVLLWIQTQKIVYGFDEKKFPVKAVQFAKQNKIRGPVFHTDEYGDYLIYAAWPEVKVFIDGRIELYEKRLRDYLKVQNLSEGWEEILERYQISWILWPARSPLVTLLKERQDWQLIYEDRVANLFAKVPKSYGSGAKN